jgi:hypothetical protein
MGGGKDDEEGSGGGTLAALAPLLGEGVKVLGEVVKAGVQARAGMMPPGMMPPGMVPPGMGRAPMLPPGYAPPPQQQMLPDYGYAQQVPQAAPQPVPVPQGNPQPVAPMQGPPAPVQAPAAPAFVSTLPLGEQKNARIALRNLVKTLRGTKAEEWENAITMALVSELAIFRYVQEIPVKFALLEAGADNPFADQIIAALRASGKIPSDIRLE